MVDTTPSARLQWKQRTDNAAPLVIVSAGEVVAIAHMSYSRAGRHDRLTALLQLDMDVKYLAAVALEMVEHAFVGHVRDGMDPMHMAELGSGACHCWNDVLL